MKGKESFAIVLVFDEEVQFFYKVREKLKHRSIMQERKVEKVKS
jgi:hypothetical protein